MASPKRTTTLAKKSHHKKRQKQHLHHKSRSRSPDKTNGPVSLDEGGATPSTTTVDPRANPDLKTDPHPHPRNRSKFDHVLTAPKASTPLHPSNIQTLFKKRPPHDGQPPSPLGRVRDTPSNSTNESKPFTTSLSLSCPNATPKTSSNHLTGIHTTPTTPTTTTLTTPTTPTTSTEKNNESSAIVTGVLSKLYISGSASYSVVVPAPSPSKIQPGSEVNRRSSLKGASTGLPPTSTTPPTPIPPPSNYEQEREKKDTSNFAIFDNRTRRAAKANVPNRRNTISFTTIIPPPRGQQEPPQQQHWLQAQQQLPLLQQQQQQLLLQQQLPTPQPQTTRSISYTILSSVIPLAQPQIYQSQQPQPNLEEVEGANNNAPQPQADPAIDSLVALYKSISALQADADQFQLNPDKTKTTAKNKRDSDSSGSSKKTSVSSAKTQTKNRKEIENSGTQSDEQKIPPPMLDCQAAAKTLLTQCEKLPKTKLKSFLLKLSTNGCQGQGQGQKGAGMEGGPTRNHKPKDQQQPRRRSRSKSIKLPRRFSRPQSLSQSQKKHGEDPEGEMCCCYPMQPCGPPDSSPNRNYPLQPPPPPPPPPRSPQNYQTMQNPSGYEAPPTYQPMQNSYGYEAPPIYPPMLNASGYEAPPTYPPMQNSYGYEAPPIDPRNYQFPQPNLNNGPQAPPQPYSLPPILAQTLFIKEETLQPPPPPPPPPRPHPRPSLNFNFNTATTIKHYPPATPPIPPRPPPPPPTPTPMRISNQMDQLPQYSFPDPDPGPPSYISGPTESNLGMYTTEPPSPPMYQMLTLTTSVNEGPPSTGCPPPFEQATPIDFNPCCPPQCECPIIPNIVLQLPCCRMCKRKRKRCPSRPNTCTCACANTQNSCKSVKQNKSRENQNRCACAKCSNNNNDCCNGNPDSHSPRRGSRHNLRHRDYESEWSLRNRSDNSLGNRRGDRRVEKTGSNRLDRDRNGRERDRDYGRRGDSNHDFRLPHHRPPSSSNSPSNGHRNGGPSMNSKRQGPWPMSCDLDPDPRAPQAQLNNKKSKAATAISPSTPKKNDAAFTGRPPAPITKPDPPPPPPPPAPIATQTPPPQPQKIPPTPGPTATTTATKTAATTTSTKRPAAPTSPRKLSPVPVPTTKAKSPLNSRKPSPSIQPTNPPPPLTTPHPAKPPRERPIRLSDNDPHPITTAHIARLNASRR